MIRVLIERQLKEGLDETLLTVMREIRQKAVHRPGYVSGETWRDASDPHRYFIISTWRSRADWDAWLQSAEREQVDEQIEPLLDAPEKITVLEQA